MWARVGRDSAIFAACGLSMALLQAAFRLLAIHDLAVTEYGRVALLLSVFNAALVLGNFGIPAAAARLASRSTGLERGRELLLALTKASVVPTLAATAAVGAATHVVTGSPRLAVIAAAGMPPMTASVVCAGFVRGKGMVWESASVQPANAAAQLVALALAAPLGLSVGTTCVLTTFSIGNAVALALAVAWVLRWANARHRPDAAADLEATPRRILAFSTWLTISNFSVLALTTLPRASLAHLSYADVAVFDLALLIYTVPQRLTWALAMALIPAAASSQAHRRRITLPSLGDVALLSVAVAVTDGALWWTHAIRRLLEHVGLRSYVGAEHMLLIVLLAAPAELFFAINSGLLQAFGRSRRLAAASIAVLALSTAAVPIALRLGPSYFAGLLALDYWALYLASRSFDAAEVEEASMFSRLLPRGRAGQVPA